MSDRKMDELSKALATTTRRQMLKILAATAAGGALSLAGARGARAGRCRRVGQPCRANFECCDFFCPPATGRCACRPGENLCQKTRRCIRCDPEATFDPATCECVCPEGTTQCGTECCSAEEECPGGYYGPTCCPPGEICCPGGFCSYYGGQC